MPPFRNVTLPFAFSVFLAPCAAHAQDTQLAPVEDEPQSELPPQFLTPSLGIGVSMSIDDDDTATGRGLWAGVEYVLLVSDWFSPRGYAGLALTFPDRSPCAFVDCDVSAKIGFLGVKARLTAPIPYVAPYLELGVGASFGSMSTRTFFTDQQMDSLAYHIPFAFGLTLGKDHGVDLGLSYLFHPGQDQVVGALAFGLTFAL